MKKRWYDQEPTLSMAISLLQNAEPVYRQKAVNHFNARLQQKHPWVFEHLKQNSGGFLAFIQKRRSMDNTAWTMIEALRFLSDEDRKVFAVAMIQYLYCLENEELPFPSSEAMSTMEAAV